jgi:hypothetical protein
VGPCVPRLRSCARGRRARARARASSGLEMSTRQIQSHRRATPAAHTRRTRRAWILSDLKSLLETGQPM